jgi:hypothetical protein
VHYALTARPHVMPVFRFMATWDIPKGLEVCITYTD